MNKTELFYFSKNDLMVSVVYNKEKGTATYECHRTMDDRETTLIEKYIEIRILQQFPSTIVYVGQNDDLQKTWDEFHEKNFKADKKTIYPDKDELINKIHNQYPDKEELLSKLQGFMLAGVNEKKITELKENADEGFCFDKIGDILRDRTENHPEEPKYRLEELETYLKEFNKLSNSNITLNSLI